MAHQEQVAGTEAIRYPVKRRPIDCSTCELNGRHRVKGSGDPHSRIWFVGEAPGKDEAEVGRPFVGRSGKLLWKMVHEALGLTRDQVYVGNIVECWPPANRTPTKTECRSCVGNIEALIAQYQPYVIVALGGVALHSLVSERLKINESVGQEFIRSDGVKVIAVNHPSYLLRLGTIPEMLNLFKMHLARAGVAARTREKTDFEAAAGYKVQLVDAAGFKSYIAFIARRGWAAFDLETGENTKPYLISSAYGGKVGVVAYWDEVKHLLPELFTSKKIAKVFQFGCGFDIPIIERELGIVVEGYVWDTFCAGVTLDSRSGVNNLTALTEWAVPDLAGYDGELERYKKKYDIKADYSKIPSEILVPYSGKDAIATALVYLKQKPIANVALMQFYMEYIREVLYPMENTGVRVDEAFLDKMIEVLKVECANIATQIKGIAKDPEFNPYSSSQITDLLFKKLRLPIAGVKMSRKTKRPSADKKTLALLAGKHKVVGLIDVLRAKDKLLGTYAERVKREMVNHRFRIRYWVGGADRDEQRGAETGRLSSTMQNIPRVNKDKPRQFEPADIFVPDPGKILLVPDYSQIELRVAALIAHDRRMIADFKAGYDAHDAVGWNLLGAPRGKKPPKEIRVKAKHVNFAKIFGASPKGLANQIGCSIIDAVKLLEQDEATYPDYWQWRREQIARTLELGYVETLFGTKRPLEIPHDEHTYSKHDLFHWQRQSLNTPIQGTAGQLLLLAQLIIKRHCVPGLDILMNIHDSSPLQVPVKMMEKAAKIVKRSMEQDVVEESWRRFKLDLSIVPLVVEIEYGEKFSQLKPLTVQ